MKLHREGYGIMLGTLVLISGLSALNYWGFTKHALLPIFILAELVLITFLVLVVQFFRIPSRDCTFGENDIVCPADGKIVVIEETQENQLMHS